MSISIKYTPIANVSYLSGVISDTARALEDTFGKFPLKLTIADIPKLEAMERVYSYDPNPYGQLIDALDKYDAVMLEVET